VSQWITKGRTQGTEALRHHPWPGTPPKLRPEQLAQWPQLLAKGAEAFGFRGQVWMAARVAEVIKREYGVRYHPTHCSRLLHKIKYSRQKPGERASQRDETAIKLWREQRTLELKKGRRGWSGRRDSQPL
jgi:transposase